MKLISLVPIIIVANTFFFYEFHTVAEDQDGCCFWYPYRVEKCVGVMVVSFYCISAGGTQAL